MFKKIASLQHPIVKHLVKLRKNKDYRDEYKSVLIEGKKLVNEVSRHLLPKLVISIDESLIPNGINEENVLIISDEILNKITGVDKAEGILAEVPLPPQDNLQNKKYLLALEGVNDPGNMGVLLRTALALGWEGVFILKGSCDPFNEKVIRASKGAIFRLPYVIGEWEELEIIVKQNRLKPYAADIKGTDLKNIKSPEEGILLILGNEAQGLSEKAKQYSEIITILMPGDMESLNVGVAGGILMYSLR